MSPERKIYLKKLKKDKITIIISRTSILLTLLLTWEILSKYKIINPFLYSSPTLIAKEINKLIISFNLFSHILQTVKEIIIAFSIAQILSIALSLLLYKFKLFAKIIDPFIILINSMPKIALGPLIIIIGGANIKSIIIMALSINLIVVTLTIYNGIKEIDINKIKLIKSLKANKYQELKYLIIPYSLSHIISSLKINISMTLIGVIMGEFLVSKKGIGYLIIYGSQIFNLNLVITGIILLSILSYIFYYFISYIEKKLITK